MSENMSIICLVQAMLSDIAQMVKAHEDGVEVLGEKTEISQTTKVKFKQQVNKLRVDCVTELNKVKL